MEVVGFKVGSPQNDMKCHKRAYTDKEGLYRYHIVDFHVGGEQAPNSTTYVSYTSRTIAACD